MPQVASPDSLQLCRISRCLYTPYVQDQHSPISSSLTTSTTTENLFMPYVFQDTTGYPRILDIVDLRPLRGRHAYKGLLEAGSSKIFAAMLGDLGVSTLCSIKTMTQFSSLFRASNQPCCLLQCSRTTQRERLRRPLVFFFVPTCWETRFPSCCYSTFSLSFFLSSYRPSCPPRCSDTTL
jgi:hypothetical protein